MFIPEGDEIISQTYRTLIGGGKYQNEALPKQDYIAKLFVIMACKEMLRHSIKLLIQ